MAKKTPEQKAGDLVVNVAGGFYVARMNMRTLRSVAETTQCSIDDLARCLVSSESFRIDTVLRFFLGMFRPLHPALTLEELEGAFDDDPEAFSSCMVQCAEAYTAAMGRLFPRQEATADAAVDPPGAPAPSPATSS